MKNVIYKSMEKKIKFKSNYRIIFIIILNLYYPFGLGFSSQNITINDFIINFLFNDLNSVEK